MEIDLNKIFASVLFGSAIGILISVVTPANASDTIQTQAPSVMIDIAQ